MDFKIIDAHFHLWFRQDTEVDGMPIRTLFNGRSLFMEKNGRWFRLYDRRTKQSGSFLSNMDYAQVSAAVVTQEFIDGIQNGYLAEVARKYPDRFFVCSMCEYIVLSWNKIIPANHTNQVLSTKGIRYPRFMQCLACRLQSSNLLYETRYLPER